MLVKLTDHTEILFLLADTRKSIDIVIRSFSPVDIWKRVLPILKDFQVECLNPKDIFSNTKTFPLSFQHLPSYQVATSSEMKNGEPGEVHINPPFPWSFSNNIAVNIPHAEHS